MELQAMGCLYRLGQSQPVVNIYLICVRGNAAKLGLDVQLIERNRRALAVLGK
jgi:hypothetical protein